MVPLGGLTGWYLMFMSSWELSLTKWTLLLWKFLKRIFVPRFLEDLFLTPQVQVLTVKRNLSISSFGDQVREFYFSRFKNHHQLRELDNNEEDTISQLAAIYYGTLEDDLERSLADQEKNLEDPAKEEIDYHLNEAIVQDAMASKQYKLPEMKGDEEPLPPGTRTATKRVKVWVFH